MSRCFPYPPPGFQRTTHYSYFLPKENHKEKKHKKEKKEKEKKDGKQRKDKDRSEEKHKEKDRKEKHKDKKWDKAKDKNKTSDHKRIEERADDHNGQKATFSIPKSEEGKDSRFAEELGKRIRYEQEAAAKRMFENISGQIQGVKHLGVTYMWEMERGKCNTMVPKVLSKEQRRVDGVGSVATTTALQKERGNGNPTVANFIIKEQRKGDGIGGAGQPVEKGNHNHQDLLRLPVEKGSHNNQGLCRLPVEKRNHNHQAQLPVEKGNHNHQALPQLPVEKGKHNHQVLPQLPVEKGKHNHQALLCPSVGKDAIKSINGKEKDTKTDDGKGDRQRDRDQEEKRNKGKDKIRDKEKEKEEKTDDGKGSMYSDRDHEKKSKGKDKNRDRQKEKEDKKRGKEEKNQKVHNKPQDIVEINWPDSQNCKLVPQNNSECFGGNDGHSKKRKHIETNGFLHEDAVWPNKAPKVASSSQQPLENGKKLELGHISSSPLNRHVIPNNVKEENVTNYKEHKKIGFIQAHQNAVDRKPLAADTSTKSVVPKPPHPDSKYLREVYSVPQMEEWPECDDQDWLFSGGNPLREPEVEFEGGGPPKVWAKGLQIELTDVFALPYVIPY